MANSTLEIWPTGLEGAKRGILISTVSSIFFWIASLISARCTPKVAEKQKWRFKNISVSMLHAIISGSCSLICFIEEPQMMEDLIKTHTTFGHTLISVSVVFSAISETNFIFRATSSFLSATALNLVCYIVVASAPICAFPGVSSTVTSNRYFLYDTVDMLIYQRTRQTFELLLHHIVIIVCFGLAMFTKLYVGYAVLALIVELNSIFLHLRQLLQCCGFVRTNHFFRLNSLINLGTFLGFRILTLAWMTRWLVINKDLVPLIFYSMGSIGLAIMTVMNIILFYRLLHSDFLRKKDSIKKEE